MSAIIPTGTGVHTNGLELTFDSILNVPVADASSVSDWNTFFSLPTYGTPFASVVVVGNMVKLYGGRNITFKSNLFNVGLPYVVRHIAKVEDKGNIVVRLNDQCFRGKSWVEYGRPGSMLTEAILPAVTYASYGVFSNCDRLTNVYLPLCTNFGGSVNDDGIFYRSYSVTATLTIPISLMTCNGGNPDGDITSWQTASGNLITVVTV